MDAIPNRDLEVCAHREVAQRKKVYPRLVAEGKMRQDKADYEIRAMEQIEAHFRRLAEIDMKGERLL